MRHALFAFLCLAVGCGSTNSDDEGTSGASGGVGGIDPSVLPSGGRVAAGGTGGDVFDCSLDPRDAEGAIDGIAIEHSDHGGGGWWLGKYWEQKSSFGDFETWGWATTVLEPVPIGVGHAVRANEIHYCIGDVRSNQPIQADSYEVTYSQFSKLGSCADATGPTGTLSYCYASPYYQGTPPEECSGEYAHVWGSVGTRLIDQLLPHVVGGGGASTSQGWTDFHTSAPETVFEFEVIGSPGSKVGHGFLRAQIGSEAVTFCVQGVTDTSEDHFDRFELEVVELGTCPGTPVAGSVTACL